MTRKPAFASPACAADEADDIYMGYASRAEIMAFLRELKETGATADMTERLKEFLPRVRDDVLYAELSSLVQPASRAAGRGQAARPPRATSARPPSRRRRRPARP